jgi:hypothetical protein
MSIDEPYEAATESYSQPTTGIEEPSLSRQTTARLRSDCVAADSDRGTDSRLLGSRPSGALQAFPPRSIAWREPCRHFRRQKMYGVLYPGDRFRYFACLRLDGVHSSDLGLERAAVPGGRYGRRVVRDWNVKITELPGLFDELQADLVDAGYPIDQSRPLIEYYGREDAHTIMVPVMADGQGQRDNG